jgi:hydrogenase expression/formation protein HypD
MKYLEEYRDPAIARGLVEQVLAKATRRWTLMEVCGGQTHTIVRQGLDELLEPVVEMIHGPGCPVCVTPLEQIDKALALAARPGVIFTSFGDMLRVPGSECDLLQVRARGGAVRVVYSPLDALELARKNPDREVVFFAVGFETTAPANAMAVWRARELGIRNFTVLVSHVTVPPAMTAILDSPANRVQAFLAAGHVCTVMGWTEYEPIAAKYQVPIIVTGFEPLDILEGIWEVEAGRAASDLNKLGGGPYGILRKTAGASCNGFSCDIICSGNGNSQKQWDVLGDSDGAQTPAWNGPHTAPGIRIDLCQ